MSTNLREETIKMVGDRDVLFVTDGEFHSSYDQFLARAGLMDYDAGYGGAEVNTNLKIVFADGWLERGEYDGSEWWAYKEMPTKPALVGKVELKEVW